MIINSYRLIIIQGQISVNNGHGQYWKRSKNFADESFYHIEDSLFLNDPNDGVYGILHSLLPGGQFTFKMRNVTFGGCGQHGGVGAMLAPQLGVENVRFDKIMYYHFFCIIWL